ncbi:MAG: hypothetical protein RLZZ04_2009 [Cyanobacteriota bacterium]|jgi:hypothetical protein
MSNSRNSKKLAMLNIVVFSFLLLFFVAYVLQLFHKNQPLPILLRYSSLIFFAVSFLISSINLYIYQFSCISSKAKAYLFEAIGFILMCLGFVFILIPLKLNTEYFIHLSLIPLYISIHINNFIKLLDQRQTKWRSRLEAFYLFLIIATPSMIFFVVWNYK